jgi:long-chain fatty acid transport protein
MRHLPAKYQPLAASIAAALCLSSNATASGFSVPEISTAGVGLANAVVANPDELGAIPYNPAAMAFHDGSSLSAGLLFLSPTFSVRTATGKHDSQNADWFALPQIQGSAKLDGNWYWGLGINAPFGLETHWPINTFPILSQTLPVPSPPAPPGTRMPLPQPTVSSLEIVDVTPTFTYAVNDELALSAGADAYYARSAAVDTSVARLRGEGWGFGFNLSALYSQGPFSAGINFHSAATIDIDGHYRTTDSTLVMLGVPRGSPFEAQLDLPWRLQLGVRYAFTDRLAAEVDWTMTGWSEFEELVAKSRANGAVIAADTNEWDDANALRVGLTYDITEATQLRVGYSYDQGAQTSEHFSARIPDSDRQLYAIGVRQALSDGWEIEAGYLYAHNNERDYTGSRPYDVNNPNDINGTNAIAGTYESDAHLIALQVSKSFGTR